MGPIDISKEEAEKIATNHFAGTSCTFRGFHGTVHEIRFGKRWGSSKLETVRICKDGSHHTCSFMASFGIAVERLRTWCAEHHGCDKEEISLWCDET